MNYTDCNEFPQKMERSTTKQSWPTPTQPVAVSGYGGEPVLYWVIQISSCKFFFRIDPKDIECKSLFFSISSTVANIYQVESMPSAASAHKLFCSEKNWLSISTTLLTPKESQETNTESTQDASSNNDRDHNEENSHSTQAWICDAGYLRLLVPEPVEAVAAAHDAGRVPIEPAAGHAPVYLVISAAQPLVQPHAVPVIATQESVLHSPPVSEYQSFLLNY